jgi:flagellar motor protein MotB
VLPEPLPSPAASGEDDNWGWLITFSDLVLQLFGFAVLAALGGAAAQVASSASLRAAVAAPATAAVSAARPAALATIDETAAPEVHGVAARTPDATAADRARLDEDALPSRPLDDDRLPAAPQAVSHPTDVAAAANAAVREARPPTQDAELHAIGRYLEQLAGRERTLGAKVATRDSEVVVEIGAMQGFAPGSAEPVPAMRPLLAEVRSLVAASPQLHVEISGHTDDVPIRTAQFPSNLELSLARASRVAQGLVGGDAALRTRVSAAGYGEQRPIASNGAAEGRARNRRVEIRLTRVAS